jgi:hypothetical protein
MHAERVGEMRNSYIIVGELRRKRPFWGSVCRCNGNAQLALKKYGVDSIFLIETRISGCLL